MQPNVDIAAKKTSSPRQAAGLVTLTQRFQRLGPEEILRFGFTVAPLLAGADKFTNLMVDWEKYLAPIAPKVTKMSPRQFMKLVGIIEIAAGIGVAINPKIFSRIVAAWLGGIISNLLLKGEYFDIALRDLGLLLGALARGKLSS